MAAPAGVTQSEALANAQKNKTAQNGTPGMPPVQHLVNAILNSQGITP